MIQIKKIILNNVRTHCLVEMIQIEINFKFNNKKKVIFIPKTTYFFQSEGFWDEKKPFSITKCPDYFFRCLSAKTLFLNRRFRNTF